MLQICRNPHVGPWMSQIGSWRIPVFLDWARINLWVACAHWECVGAQIWGHHIGGKHVCQKEVSAFTGIITHVWHGAPCITKMSPIIRAPL